MTENHDDATTRAASYAVGALTAEERSRLEAELAADPRLAAEVREFTETTAVLGLAVPPVAPSDLVRGRLLDAIEDAPQEALRPVRELGRPWYSRPLTALVAAAAAAVIAIGGVALATTISRDQPSVLDQIVAAADYESSSTDITGGGTLTVVWSLSLERAGIIASGMAEAPSGHTYQLWYMDAEGNATSAGTFEPGADGTRTMALAGDMDAGDTIGITIEPEGGSPTPSTDPIAVITTA